MRPRESLIGQPVRSLQTMLRVLAESDDTLPSVVPDGIYGQNTSTAVSSFQRRAGLPITGVADQATWDILVPAYEAALIAVDEAEPLRIVLNSNQIIRQGERNPNIWLVQAALAVLGLAYGGIPAPGMTGVLDLPTAESLAAFQRFSSLPETGELDKQTWKHLALHYPMATNLLTQE